MAKPTRRQIWLMRGISEKQSLMFALSIKIEREGDFYAACVSNMDEQMAATGRSADEALTNARLLFMATVDDAITKSASIQFATGQEPITLDLPAWMAPKFFHLLERELLKAEAEEIDQWFSIPTTETDVLQHVD